MDEKRRRDGGLVYIGNTAKIESSDIDTSELDTSGGDRPSCAKSYNRASEKKLGDGMHGRQMQKSMHAVKDSSSKTVRTTARLYEGRIKRVWVTAAVNRSGMHSETEKRETKQETSRVSGEDCIQ